MSERVVEQRLRLGNAAPELLDAYRAETIDLDTLKAFAVTTDHERQLSVFEQATSQGYRPTAWQVKRLLTEERVPASAAIARFVGVDAYEAAGGPVLRDLFADEYENGVWLEDPKLLNELATAKLTAAAGELATRWKWAEPCWRRTGAPPRATGASTRSPPRRPTPRAPRSSGFAPATTRSPPWKSMSGPTSSWRRPRPSRQRLHAIGDAVDARATFRPEDFAMAGCIATIGRDGTLQVIQGLVKPEDMPKEPAGDANGRDADAGAEGTTDAASRVDAPAMTTPIASPPDPRAKARADAGVGIGLADDLRAIRTALVKAHLAGDFEAAFDLVVFQMVRSIFARGYTASWHALDIAFNETAERPSARANDDGFAAWSPGEAMLADWSDLPFEWMEGEDDAACFAALQALPRADKERLFAAAAARTVKGQLAFEHDARPELEATVARLGIDFAKHVRPTAEMLWSRITKSRILDVARETFGAAWAAARSKYKKADLAKSMEAAFAAGPPPVGLGATAHAAALAWTVPGIRGVRCGRLARRGPGTEPAAAAPPAGDAPDASGEATASLAPEDRPRTPSVVESIESPAAAESRAAALAAAKSNGNGASNGAPEPGDAEVPDGPAGGNGHAAPVHPEDEAGPEPANVAGEGEDRPAEPSVADAIDAMNAVPTADGGPRVVVQTVGPVNGAEAGGDEALDIPEFLRRVH